MSGNLPPAGPDPAGPHPARVLIVDDELNNLVMMQTLLQAWGHQVTLASSGEECLRRAVQDSPDIILLDVQMGRMDGYATANALHGDDATRAIPVVMVTGRSHKEERLRALKAGAVDLLPKPVDADELKAKVASLARIRNYNEAMRQREAELSRALSSQGDHLQAALEAFSRFVPRELIRLLGKEGVSELHLGDQVQLDLSILFSDIRSFTSLSETMTPRENFAFLNSYLARMNPFVWENGGFIDKYMGDAIMALFPRGAGSALSAAVAMIGHLPVYNQHRAAFGYAPIRVGIGVHSGRVMLGIIGHERFLQGTAISDAVNLASRLEELTKVYGVSLVVSSHVLFDLEDPNRFEFRFLDKLHLRGKQEPVSVYEVFDGDAPDVRARKRRTRNEFEKAVYRFHAGDARGAREAFEALREGGEPDPPVEIYRARCARALTQENPAARPVG